jgi:hypothetical protein
MLDNIFSDIINDLSDFMPVCWNTNVNIKYLQKLILKLNTHLQDSRKYEAVILNLNAALDSLQHEKKFIAVKSLKQLNELNNMFYLIYSAIVGLICADFNFLDADELEELDVDIIEVNNIKNHEFMFMELMHDAYKIIIDYN